MSAGTSGLTDQQRHYREVYLKSDHWQRVRASALLRAKHRCESCGSKKRLDVHHLTYRRLGAEAPDDLRVLCRPCRESVHAVPKQLPQPKRKTRKKRRRKKAKPIPVLLAGDILREEAHADYLALKTPTRRQHPVKRTPRPAFPWERDSHRHRTDDLRTELQKYIRAVDQATGTRRTRQLQLRRLRSMADRVGQREQLELILARVDERAGLKRTA